MRRPDCQRGYTIVEMAIALVVLGLVIGGALVPLQVRFEQEEIKSAENHLAQAREAVLAYALKHGTIRSAIVYYDGVEYELPANRPYLPCPDIDNDGLEDRRALPIAYPVTVSVPSSPLSNAGHCEQLKGMLPWKTLGTKELDPWGNHLTYRVDKNFSSRLYGFDETFRADIFDVSMPLTVLANGEVQYETYLSRDDAGAVICSQLFDNLSTGGCPQSDLVNLEMGIVTTMTLTLGARVVQPYTDVVTVAAAGVIEGAVFVIVSHGKNGYGAVNREGKCRVSPQVTDNLIEVANAHYRSGHPFLAPPFDCSLPAGLTVNRFENAFVSAPIRKTGDSPSDDMVVWGGSNELFGLLARSGRLPLAKLEYLP